jgi:single-stranded-DNA-specific exonuclease
MSSLKPRWQIYPPAVPSFTAQLSTLHPTVAQVLYNRGLTDVDEVSAFLSKTSCEGNPFTLAGVQEATARLRRALRNSEKVTVYGDFDADGVTATAVLTETLQSLGGDVHMYIPDRVKEGYGLRREALHRLRQDGTKLVVTVDCGIRSVDEINYAGEIGLDVIVTDHHSVGQDLPQAVAVVDPKRLDSRYPNRDLAGVGVAFKLAQALLQVERQAPLLHTQPASTEDDLLDLVALGTIADMVPLLGENRILVRRGLQCLNNTCRPGLRELIKLARLSQGKIDSTSVGYSIGPRINAAGRIAHADLAYRLLTTSYPAEASHLAEELDHLNRERQRITRDIQERAVSAALDAPDELLLFAAAPDFPAGVLGLAASRLVDEFYRPAIVVEKGEEYSKGSARSVQGFNITRALDKCASLLVRYGGHAAAAGFTVPTADLEVLAGRLQSIARDELVDTDLTPVLTIDASLRLSALSWDLYNELSQLEPFGYANPRPVFAAKNVLVRHYRTVGADRSHLKLALSDGDSTWDAIAFRQGAWAAHMPDRIDVAFHLDSNEWNGQTQLQLGIRDLRPSFAPEGTSAHRPDGPGSREAAEGGRNR